MEFHNEHLTSVTQFSKHFQVGACTRYLFNTCVFSLDECCQTKQVTGLYLNILHRLTLYFILKMAKHTFKILRRKHQKIFKVCLSFF